MTSSRVVPEPGDDGATSHSGAPAGPPEPSGSRARVVLSSFLGSTIEWFDFYIYGLASGLYFAKEFFPGANPLVGLIAAFGAMAGGFLVRPLGGIIGGHFGDKYGRKRVLVASMIVMGASTFLVGLVPGYARIGVWAPILLVLLRLVQGIGAGAEWGGGALMVIEHFAHRRRGFWGSIGVLGVYSGITISTLLFYAVSKLPADTQQIAWRIPFLCSAVLIVIGLWIRAGVADSPAFAQRRTHAKVPVFALLRRRWPRVLLGIALAIGPAVPYQVYVTFGNSYGKMMDFPVSTLLLMQLVASVLAMVLAPAFGALSDVLGRRPVVIAGCVVLCPSAFWFFTAINDGNGATAMAALIVLEVGHSMLYGPQSAMLSELYDTGVRYTGVSVAYQIAGALSGLAPIISASLLEAAGGPPHVLWVPAVLVVTSLGTVMAAAVTKESARHPLPA
ncbi:MFS transporter [Amycolatopsis ultiminotia]|uniref:MFS transporter n=1 Tax=Amycolatopsis ultiminotia TaxID=543629 RepID=A0ABP6UXH5_9PSEU